MRTGLAMNDVQEDLRHNLNLTNYTTGKGKVCFVCTGCCDHACLMNVVQPMCERMATGLVFGWQKGGNTHISNIIIESAARLVLIIENGCSPR